MVCTDVRRVAASVYKVQWSFPRPRVRRYATGPVSVVVSYGGAQGPPTPTGAMTGVLVLRSGPKWGALSVIAPVPTVPKKKHVQHCVFGELSSAAL